MNVHLDKLLRIVVTIIPYTLLPDKETCQIATQQQTMGLHMLLGLWASFLVIFIFFTKNKLKLTIKFSGLISTICFFQYMINHKIVFTDPNSIEAYIFMYHLWFEVIKQFTRQHQSTCEWFDLIALIVPIYAIAMNHSVQSTHMTLLMFGTIAGLIVPDLFIQEMNRMCDMLYLYTQSEHT